jgi:hypothetical protein
MTHFVLLGFLLAHVWVYFNTKQANEKNFKKWAIPLSLFGIAVMIIVNITAFFYEPIIVFSFPLHIFAVILAICNSLICVDCGKWIDKDSDWFSNYKQCTKCKAIREAEEI